MIDQAKSGRVCPAVSRSWGENNRLNVSPLPFVTTIGELAFVERTVPALVPKYTLVNITMDPSVASLNARLLVMPNGITVGAGNALLMKVPSLFVLMRKDVVRSFVSPSNSSVLLKLESQPTNVSDTPCGGRKSWP